MNNAQCRYWSKSNSSECRMLKGGLYLPLPGHIAMYCSTGRYIKCYQYIRGTGLLREMAKKYGYIVGGGRRRYRRVKDRVPLKVFNSDQASNTLDVLDQRAVTVDFSLGGLRIESSKKIAQHAFVYLDFTSGLAGPQAAGLCEVKWCESQDDSNLFEAGVAFSDSRLTEAIGTYLGLPMK